MTDIEHRQVGRDSLFLMADLRLEGRPDEHRVKVRNLSARGMMAEGTVKVAHGIVVEIHLRNIGWVAGQVAWIQDNRFGIAFDQEIDARVVRAPAQAAGEAPRFTRPLVQAPDPRKLRKI